MACELSQIETRELRVCENCRNEPRLKDKFCRQCGARLVDLEFPDFKNPSAPQDSFHQVSGPLITTALRDLSRDTDALQAPIVRRTLSILLAVPIWLMILLLSPLDAYTKAKLLSKLK
jgi:hypothetical protein